MIQRLNFTCQENTKRKSPKPWNANNIIKETTNTPSLVTKRKEIGESEIPRFHFSFPKQTNKFQEKRRETQKSTWLWDYRFDIIRWVNADWFLWDFLVLSEEWDLWERMWVRERKKEREKKWFQGREPLEREGLFWIWNCISRRLTVRECYIINDVSLGSTIF